jgi:hypothetical protein
VDDRRRAQIDPHGSDIARFYEHQRTKTHIDARASEGFNKTYGIVHPAEQWLSDRDVRVAPFVERERALGAVFVEGGGFERPNWYASNAPLLEEYGDRVMPREAEWDARWWSPIVNAEHLAMRDRVGLVDLSAFSIFDVSGPGALGALQGVAVAQMDVPVGRVVYTPLLNPGGGVKADLTIMRLGPDAFRVVTGAGSGRIDRKWFVDHLPTDGRAHLSDQTSAWCTIGWGLGRATSWARSPATTSRTRGSGSPRAARSRSGRSGCWRRGSPTWASSAGSCTCRWSRAFAYGTCSSRAASRKARCRSVWACT